MKKIIIVITALCLLASTGCHKNTANSSSVSGSDETNSYESNENPSTGSSAQSSAVAGSTAPGSAAASNTTSSKTASIKPTPTAAPTVTPIPTVNVTIPEGFSAAQIGDRLEANKVCSKKDFLAIINSYDFSYYSLVSKIPANANRCFKLEGYLFPDTYAFYFNMKPQDVIGKMLRISEIKIGSKYSYTGMSTNDIIILASIIQQEASNSADMKKVSAVFHNRLVKKMQLNADPTINYVEWYIVPNISGDKDRYDNYYNTYKEQCPALPAGAICNPGANALLAAASPATTDMLYFVTDSSGKFYYAKTLEDHIENCKTAGVTPAP